ncbi:MAG: hypothetical protein HC827_00465 [Cyanobacteria bacterium RM1_2_2]|nr:hypothetical protein [Cyanobacteria bacterium RM1_2_2]
MTQATLPKNGSSAHPPQAWLRQTVQQFFNAINWDDHPPEIQTLRLAARNESHSPLLLTVSQFFSTINWEGDAAVPLKPPSVASAEADDALTLEEFTDLF